MNTDPIVAELHQQRKEEMERFNFDFEAFCRYLKEQEKLSTELLLPPPASAPNNTVQRTRLARR